MTTLREYQQAVIENFHSHASEKRRVLMVAPTGAGKTVIFAAIIKEFVAKGKRVLVLAHRRELISQAHEKLFALGIDAGTILAGYPTRPSARVQIGSIQTLHRRAVNGKSMEMPESDLVVIDEAHHVMASSYKDIIRQYPNAVVLGVTATPCRGDGKGLGNVFDVMIETPQVGSLIKHGFLVKSVCYAPVNPDLKGVRVSKGDYAVGQLSTRMNTKGLVGDIVENWFKYGEDRTTVVFAVDVAHSKHIRDVFRDAGVPAEHIDGDTPREEREMILRRLAEGEVRVLANCMVLTEGWDCPPVSCIILARPTKQLGLYRQMVGRGLRPDEGKNDCIIIDHSGAVYKHGLPEDEIGWRLSEDTLAENKTKKERTNGGGERDALCSCPKCNAIRAAGKPCEACGWKPAGKEPREIEFEKGHLDRVNKSGIANERSYSEDDKKRWYAELIGVAEQRGYKRGSAYHRYIEKFNEKPLEDWRWIQSSEASLEVLNWVKSRDIAYSKAMRAKNMVMRKFA